MKEERIETIGELYKNILYLEDKLNSSNKRTSEIAKDLIKNGICFVRYKIDNRVVFAPSRFIGYKNNNLQKHQSSTTKHGTDTNVRLRKILRNRAESNSKIQKEYFSFCRNYSIEPKNISRRKFWDIENLEIDAYGNVEFSEGKKIMIAHVRRERSPRLRQIAIDNFLNKHGHLFCEACDFDFENKYGKLGEGFIECHHKISLSSMNEGHKSKPEDLLLVCSNCHRMIHKKQPWLTLNELKKLLKKK